MKNTIIEHVKTLGTMLLFVVICAGLFLAFNIDVICNGTASLSTMLIVCGILFGVVAISGVIVITKDVIEYKKESNIF